MARGKNLKNPFLTLSPSAIFQLFSLSPINSPLLSSKKSPRKHHSLCTPPAISFLFLSLMVSFTSSAVVVLRLMFPPQDSVPCSLTSPSPSSWNRAASSSYFQLLLDSDSDSKEELKMENGVMVPLPVHAMVGNLSEEEREFWKQPDGEGFRPCLDFSIEYRKKSVKISKEKRRFLMVVASGGLNQQRNQIVDAVVIARILEAALVVPVLQVNLIWEDESEFPDIFDVEHFKRTLQSDVRIVSSLPSTHLIPRQSIHNQIPHHVSPLWIRSRFFKQLNEEGVLILKGLDSKLSKNLPADLQKLRCKVAFHALRFVAPIQELGNQLARRMWIEGPYIAIHLRLEKDVWVRTGCLTGLGPEYDEIITRTQETEPKYLTGRLNISHSRRRLSGLCPLNAFEMARLLKALGAPSSARMYLAGGKPFGGSKALQPLAAKFPNLVTKEMLAREDELSPYTKKSSALAAIDYIVSLSSEVFIPSHGGNMARTMKGHRSFIGHRKYITPDKRAMVPFLEDSTLSDTEFKSLMTKMHRKSQGQPEPRNKKRDRDVIAYPVPECMCKHGSSIF
ncbi:hypothetical protein SLEP1_g17461 [Rubroshorea leprosula]|uniref:O-fucosyltransferase family protein n=1 Tax=Rubroshorea leprosula TaxID=152421 RepID=A0AAV5IZX0_9ROSI|nr:hypothetical protein SLEP1_g17461 [Rubroshorea leprosula]